MFQINQVLLGRFRIDGIIGFGGMGTVYKVWDTHRNVTLAMKVLRPEFVSDIQAIEYFQQEARMLKELAHPNIVPFYGLFHSKSISFILQEYIDGFSLKDILREYDGKILKLEKILRYAQQVCSALSYAHAKTIIHCDIKPANILEDRSGRIYLADLGIARYMGSSNNILGSAGTPFYMAPEQIRGLNPTPQMDIYSLGIVLFEMLSGGHKPFTGERAKIVGDTQEKVRWEQLHLLPPQLLSLNPDLSPQLEGVIMRCLDKDPNQRYKSALDLLNDITVAIALLLETSTKGKSGLPENTNSPVTSPTLSWNIKLGRYFHRIMHHWLLFGAIFLILLLTFIAYKADIFPRNTSSTILPTINGTTITRTVLVPTLRVVVSTSTSRPSFNTSVCMQVVLDKNNKVSECITTVTILPDGKIRLGFTWNASLQDGAQVKIFSSTGSKSMYLADDLGNKYPLLQAGGDASRTILLKGQEIATGWFLFEPLSSDATYFVFHDDDNQIVSDPIFID